MKKDLYIKCPDCDVEMRIDRDSGEIISHGKKDQPSGIDFGQALAAENNRKNELDDLFTQAAKKAEEKPDRPDDLNNDKWT
ncbi:MAG: hypothetical protein P8L98_02945 [Planctomycetota bacterium]|jgi:GrpB-like predicted nucleotidyltransferase (UPF0157 family)|nr:hypothetical protein [Planctomycetota bacterium]MDG1405925.1 hypothetical protein [Planctomycetota bacterium]MDG2309521.1 hypothetical protein [Planctomycetota bacterium]